MLNHYEVYVIFQNIENQLQEITFFIIFFNEIFILKLELSFINSKLFTGNFCDIAHPSRLFAFQY